MALADQYSSTYAAIVSLLKAEPTLYDANSANRNRIFPANFIDYTESGTAFPSKPSNVKQADTPTLYIDEASEGDSGTSGTPSSIGNVALPFGTCDQIQRTTLEYNIFIIGRDTTLAMVSNLRWAVKVALEKGGRTLGFSNHTVQFWRLRSQMSLTSNLQIGERNVCGTGLKRVCKITVLVYFQFDGNAIIS